MASPDLFVVCKNCGSEVSPYVTECPYCGTRLRKRAPKLERGSFPKSPPPAPPPPPRTRPRLERMRREEPSRPRGDAKPWISIGLVVASLLLSLALEARFVALDTVALAGPIETEWWRTASTLFTYTQGGYRAVALAATFLFAWRLERRHGWWAPLLVFVVAGVAGTLLVAVLDPGGIALGANGAALALVAAWAMRDVLGRRQGREDDADMLGVLVVAAVLLLLPLASEEAHVLAGLGSGVVGILLGLVLARAPER